MSWANRLAHGSHTDLKRWVTRCVPGYRSCAEDWDTKSSILAIADFKPRPEHWPQHSLSAGLTKAKYPEVATQESLRGPFERVAQKARTGSGQDESWNGELDQQTREDKKKRIVLQIEWFLAVSKSLLPQVTGVAIKRQGCIDVFGCSSQQELVKLSKVNRCLERK